MKSPASVLLHVTQGLCKDVLAAYPAMRGVDLDLERLTLYYRTRGQTLFTLDLPHLESLLLQGLENGRLQLEGPLSKAVSKRVRVPRLFQGLWLRVFDKNACLRQEPDAYAILLLRQFCCLGKKLHVACSPDRVQLALEKYHGIERGLRLPTLWWGTDYLGVHEDCRRLSLDDDALGSVSHSSEFPVSSLDEAKETEEERQELRRLLRNVQRVADIVVGSFDTYDPISLSEVWESMGRGTGFRHGPGAVSEKLENHEKSEFPNWPEKLQLTFPYEFVGKTAGSDAERPSQEEEPSRLICVPKTAKSPRIIAAEPTAHQYCQQHMLRYFMDQFTRHFGVNPDDKSPWFIDLRKQKKSGDLVLQSSLDRSLATVDLSDASDRLSCWTVERMFRKNIPLLYALNAARTTLLRDDVSKQPKLLRLKKFASQGTAVTFPVQSIVFLCIALGCSIKGPATWDKIFRLRSQVRVYGDDIILPTHGYAPLLRVMTHLQLQVNMAKSYVHGHFRESCGTDGYMGDDVTPVKPQVVVADSPASCQAVVDTVNNLFNKGLWNASDSLRATIPPRVQRGLRTVAIHDTGFAGLTSFSGSDESHLAKRWNPRLHRYEVRVWSLQNQTRTRERQGFSVLLDFVSRIHNHEHARIVSEYGESRKARDGFLWEPLNTSARVHALLGAESGYLDIRSWPDRPLRSRRPRVRALEARVRT